MNIITPTAIAPGLKIKVFDPDEPPIEWLEFTVVRIDGQRVELLSPSNEKTWATLNELFLT